MLLRLNVRGSLKEVHGKIVSIGTSGMYSPKALCRGVTNPSSQARAMEPEKVASVTSMEK